MPYIVDNQRRQFDKEIDLLIAKVIEVAPSDKLAGAANYTLTRVLLGILDPLNYTQMNEAIGVLECAKLELYRRLVGPYEDKAIEKNGDLKEYGH